MIEARTMVATMMFIKVTIMLMMISIVIIMKVKQIGKTDCNTDNNNEDNRMITQEFRLLLLFWY